WQLVARPPWRRRSERVPVAAGVAEQPDAPVLLTEGSVVGLRADGGGDLELSRRRAAGRVVAVAVVDRAARDRRPPAWGAGERDPVAERDLAAAAVDHVRERAVAPGEEVAVDERALADRDRLPVGDPDGDQRQTVRHQ